MSRLNTLWVYKPVEHVTTAGGEDSFMTHGWLPVVHASVTTTHCLTTHVQSSTPKLFTLCFCIHGNSIYNTTHDTTQCHTEMGVNGDINTSRKIPVYHGMPCFSGCSGVVIEYRTRNREVAGSTHTRSALQATLSKLLNYCVLRLTQPPTLSGTENE